MTNIPSRTSLMVTPSSEYSLFEGEDYCERKEGCKREIVALASAGPIFRAVMGMNVVLVVISGIMGLWSWSSLDGWSVNGYSNVVSSRIGKRHLVGGNARSLTMVQDGGLGQHKGIEIDSVSSGNAPASVRCANNWSPSSWRSKKAMQQPDYKDKALEQESLTRLSQQSPLVFAGEVRHLHTELMRASEGERFVLMGGDCAESFKGFKVDSVRDSFRVVLQMALVLTYGSGIPVTKILRMAGQFAKPRSEDTETVNGVTLPSYRGDIVNDNEFTPEAREHDPSRMLTAYHQSAQTLNMLRAFASGGFAALSRLHMWNLDFVHQSEPGSHYRTFANKVSESLRFMKAVGFDLDCPELKLVNAFTSHEALLLPYEEALTRVDSTTGLYYDCSAHMVWIGERTRQLDGAHVEFVRGIENPIGIKVSSALSPEDLMKLLELVNPENIAGRIMLITRMHAKNLVHHLPKLIRAVQREGRHVLWVCDPMHGNTVITPEGVKTRSFDSIRDELRAFFDVHAQMGSYAGGIHVEMTGENVTECVGGCVANVKETDLHKRYESQCDPRLNGMQALELSFLIADRLRKQSGLPALNVSN